MGALNSLAPNLEAHILELQKTIQELREIFKEMAASDKAEEQLLKDILTTLSDGLS